MALLVQAVLCLQRYRNKTVYFGALICPFSTKSLLRLHSFLLTRLFVQSLKKQRKQKTPVLGWANKDLIHF